MIQINELKISSDGSNLIVDVQIKDNPVYANVYLEYIKIDTQDTFIGSTPSNDCVYSKIFEDNIKSIQLTIPANEIMADLTSNLFFIFIKAKGSPTEIVECNQDTNLVIGSVFYSYPIYCRLLNSIQQSELACCEPPMFFIDEFLKYKALQLALISGDAMAAADYYKRFFKGNASIINQPCKCNG